MKNQWIVSLLKKPEWAGKSFSPVMWILSLALFASAETLGADFSVTTNADNTITISGYLGSDVNVVIPATINGRAVTAIGDKVFQDKTDLTSISIPNGIKSIGYWTFSGCTTLPYAAIPTSVTQIKTGAFAGCTELGRVVIDNAYIDIGDAAFSGCSRLFEVVIPTSTTLPVPSYSMKIGQHAFEGCISLTEINLGVGFTSIADWAFFNCTGMTKVTIGSRAQSLGPDAFGGCTSLRSVYFTGNPPAAQNNSPTHSVFYGSTNVVIYYLPGATGWGSLFDGWPTASKEYTYTVYANKITITGYLGTKGQITIPTTIDGLPVTGIARLAFYQNTSITNVTIGSNVTSLGEYAFWNSTKLAKVTIASSIPRLETETFSGCSSLTSVTIPGSVTNIGNSVFMNCSALTSISIPSTVKWLGDYVFQGCTGLTTVTIAAGIPSIGDGAFDGCTRLTSITIPTSVTSLGEGAFYGCSSLPGITLPASLTTIQGYLFHNCTSLKSVYFAGNAPYLWGQFPSVFSAGMNVVVYYAAGTTGWGSTFYGMPTAVLNQTNLILNPSFEIGGSAPTSWTRGGSAVGSTVSAQDGTNSLRIATAGINAPTTQTIAIKAGTTYSISVWINASGVTSGKATFDTSDKYDGAGQGQFVISAANAGWTKYSGSFTATNTSVTLRIFTDSTFKGTIYFDNVVLEPSTQLPSPWKTQDIGSVGKSGDATYNNGSFTLKAGGRQIGGTSDALRYVHQVSSGDCDIKVKVVSLTNTLAGARSGVMIRESLNGNARAAGVWVSPTNGIYFTYRTGTGSTATNIVSTGKKAPYWVRLTRTGNTFKAYYGTTGTNWTQLGATATISMSTNAYIGMGLCSGDTNKLATTVIGNVTATP